VAAFCQTLTNFGLGTESIVKRCLEKPLDQRSSSGYTLGRSHRYDSLLSSFFGAFFESTSAIHRINADSCIGVGGQRRLAAGSTLGKPA